MEYFSHCYEKQKRCCSVCDNDKPIQNTGNMCQENVLKKSVCIENQDKLSEALSEIVNDWKLQCLNIGSFSTEFIPEDIIMTIMKNVSVISDERDLLMKFGIWEQSISLRMFEVIQKYAR